MHAPVMFRRTQHFDVHWVYKGPSHIAHFMAAWTHVQADATWKLQALCLVVAHYDILWHLDALAVGEPAYGVIVVVARRLAVGKLHRALKLSGHLARRSGRLFFTRES